jgi:hypothetical protein
MKKLVGISLIALLAVGPLAANAEVGDVISVSDPAHDNNATAATTLPGYALVTEGANDGKVATAGYVKGAYNAAMKAINKVATTAGNAADQDLSNISATGEGVIKDLAAGGAYDNTDSGLSATTIQDAIDEVAATADTAVQSVTAGTANGTISVDGGADVTVYDDSTLAGRVTAVESEIGNTTLTTTAQTLTGAIEEVKGTAGFAGTASELTDTNFQAADKTSAAKAANAAMAAAAAAQSDVDAVENTIGNTTLTTTAQTLTGAIEEVKSNALTSAALATYATQAGVENTIETATITATVPTLTAWGNDNSTGTVGVTVSAISATYAEPVAQGGN